MSPDGGVNFSFFVSLLFFLLLLRSAVEAQPGFISLDCGLPKKDNYTERGTGIIYVSDEPYVDTGEAQIVKANESARHYQTLRAFPKGNRNCYNLRPLQEAGKYLVRAEFFYGDYDGLRNPPEFELHVGVNSRIIVSLPVNETYIVEFIEVANGDSIWVCLINTAKGTPIISTIQLRLLPDVSYDQANASQSLHVRARFNYGAATLVRYPIDQYDRMWFPLSGSLPTINTTMPVKKDLKDQFQVPSLVLQTAITVPNVSYQLDIQAATGLSTDTVYIVLHFAELQNLGRSNKSRIMNLFGFGRENVSLSDYSVKYLITTRVTYTDVGIGSTNIYNISIRPSNMSALPPMINAMESFVVKKVDELPTNIVDVQAIQDIKTAYKLVRNWQGDPCVPSDYLWDGIECSYYDNTKAPRIIHLDLSSSGLTAKIPDAIGDLTALRTLNVSNNSIPIIVPDLLAKLPSLELLDLSGNNVTGVSENLCSRALTRKISPRIEGLKAVCSNFTQQTPMSSPGKSGSASIRHGFHVFAAAFLALLGFIFA